MSDINVNYSFRSYFHSEDEERKRHNLYQELIDLELSERESLLETVDVMTTVALDRKYQLLHQAISNNDMLFIHKIFEINPFLVYTLFKKFE